eukprot:scaffold19192_cov85-Isochrysis_galbana.AAC.1
MCDDAREQAGELLRVRLTLGEGTRFGMHLNDANTVVRLDASGLAAAEGTLQPGDRVVGVDGVSTDGRLVRDLLRSDGTIRPDGSLVQDGRAVLFLARRPSAGAAAAAPIPAGAPQPPGAGLEAHQPQAASMPYGDGSSGRVGAVHAATDWLRSRFAPQRNTEAEWAGGGGTSVPLGGGAAGRRPRHFPPAAPAPPAPPPPRVFPRPSSPREQSG